MNTNKPFRRLLSLAMSLLLVLGAVPLSAFAQETDLPIGASGEIIDFAELAEETASQSVPLGTSLAELDLPDSLSATVKMSEAAATGSIGDCGEIPEQEPEIERSDEDDSAEEPGVATPSDVRDDPDSGTEIEGGEPDEPDAPAQLTIPVQVTWTAQPDYDGDAAGTYIFTTEVEGFSVSAPLPTITVTVGESTAGEITAFEPLGDEIAAQSVPMGTPLSELILPGTLAATVDGEAASVPVTWNSQPEYNPGHEDEHPGEYIFTAQIPEGYTLADGVSTPQITVNTRIVPMLRAGAPIDITGKTVGQIKTDIETELSTENVVTVIGSQTGVSSSLFLDIPTGKTVKWAATFEADSGFSGSLIALPGDGIFEVTTGGTVSATAGRAINASGTSATVIVSGGVVSATDDYGWAIYTTGANSTVTVSGGTVSATGDYGRAIYADGTSSTVTISGGTVTGAGSGVNYPVIYMDNGSNTGLNVTVSGKVSAIGTNGYAIRTSGSVEVKNSAEVTATGWAIYATGANSTVAVSDGTVSATTGTAIRASGANSTVTVSGGVVTGAGNNANYPVIYMTNASNTGLNVTVSGTGKVNATANGGYAILTFGSVEVKDNAEVTATGRAIYATGTSSTVTISGGTVTGAGSGVNYPVIYMDNGSNTGLNVTVSDTGKVKATADGGYAISTSGSVEVKDSAEVTATTGVAIYTYGSVEVKDSAEVTATTGWAIHASGTSSTVTVSGGTVSATGAQGIAINATGWGSNVTISGGTVSATDTGIAIYATSANSTVTVSGGTVTGAGSGGNYPVIYMNNVSNTVLNVTVSGTSKVKATANVGIAIRTSGSVEVKDSAEVSATTGTAISAIGTSSTVTVSGGTVSATTGDAISASGTSSTVTVSGTSKVKATANGGYAILTFGSVEVKDSAEVSATTGTAIGAPGTSSTVTVSGTSKVKATNGGYAIFIAGSVEVKDSAEVSATTITAIWADGASSTVTVSGGTVSATTGRSIHTTGTSSTVTVSGGTVFAHRGSITGANGVIYLQNNPGGFTNATGTGVVIAWNAAANNRTYSVRGTEDITTSPASAAYWYNSGSAGGISYQNGVNEGFIPLTGVTVTKITMTAADLTYTNPATLTHTYSGSPQGIGAVTMNPPHDTAFDSTTGGMFAVHYNGSATVPTNAGTYAVTAEISGGTEYEAVSISLGDYTIAKSNPTVTWPTSATITYGQTLADAVLTGQIGTGIFAYTTGTTKPTVAQSGTAYSMTFTPPDSTNYNTLTQNVAVTVNKATTAGVNQTYEVVENTAQNYNFNFASLLPNAEGLTGVSYSPAITTNADGVLGALSYTSGSTLVLPVNSVSAGKTAVITVTVSSDNHLDFTAVITVNSVAKTPVTITANVNSRTYNGTPYSYSGVAITKNSDSTSVNGIIPDALFVSTDGASYSSNIPPTNAGAYKLTLSVPVGNPTYTGSNDFNFTIDKAAVTVKADDKTALVGGAIPATTVSYSGFVGSDTAANTLATPAAAGHDAGASTTAAATFPITFTTQAVANNTNGPNYTLNHVNGTLTVSAIPQRTISYDANGGTGYMAPNTVNDSTSYTIAANTFTRSNYTFTGWRTAPNSGTFYGAGATIPAVTANITLYAQWSDNSGSGNTDNGSNNSSTYGGLVGGWTVSPGKTTDMPTTATQSNTSKPDTSGKLTMTVTKKMIEDGIKQAKATGTGRELFGIALAFENSAENVKSLTATIDANALDYLVAQGVKSLTIQCGIIRITLDAKAIKELDIQSSSNVTVTVSPYKVSGAAANAIGTRPVYDITFKDSTGKMISSFGKGNIAIGIAYKTSNAGTGNLFAVYVKSNSNIEWLQNSSYDNGWLLFSRNSLSVYGVGYKTSAAFTDTATHWAKDNIDFVVSRGLFSGTTDTTFSPNTAITRGMFVTALGRLSGADVSGYTTSSFSDVKSGSYYLSYIEWAVKNGIVKGTGNNQFAPDRAITREEMAVIMQNYAKVAGYTLPVTRQYAAFADDWKISSFAKDAVIATQQAGIINGKDSNKFDPQGNATRAEAATILRRFIELVIDESTATGWVKNDSGQWQYYNWQGKRTTSWLTVTGTDIKYYFDANGIMVSGKWVEIGGKWYYFYTDGKLARSTTVEGYKVDSDGERQEK